MNPELRNNPVFVPYFMEMQSPLPNSETENPLQLRFVELQQKTLERASRIMDFTDKHPVFATHIKKRYLRHTGESDLRAFSETDAAFHHSVWETRGFMGVDESALASAKFGMKVVFDLISDMRFIDTQKHVRFPDLDKIKPFLDYPIKNSLQGMCKDSSEFERALKLICFLALQNHKDKDQLYAIFSVCVGFAQAISDEMMKNENHPKNEEKRTRRDQILLFATQKFDSGIGEYLAELNGI